METLTKSSSQTKKSARALAKRFLRTKFEKEALIIGLEGELGSGKTTFLQGFAKGLGIKEKVLSPTFVILKKFRIPEVKSQKSKVKSRWFYHVDCHRIKKPKEILDLGFKEIISNPQNVVAIEWSNKIKKFLPKKSLILKFQLINKNSRKICLTEKRD